MDFEALARPTEITDAEHPHSLHLRIVTSPGRALKGPGEGNPKLKLLSAGALLVFGLCALASARAQADVIYTYTGNPFTVGKNGSPPPDLPYTTNDRVIGQFVLSAPLAANLPFPPLSSNYSIIPLSFSFTDGVNTITSTSQDLGGIELFVATDASANIILWEIVVNTIHAFFSISTNDRPETPAGDGGEIISLLPLEIVASGENINDPGVWSMATVPATSPAPEPSSLTLLGAALALLLFARPGNRRGRRA